MVRNPAAQHNRVQYTDKRTRRHNSHWCGRYDKNYYRHDKTIPITDANKICEEKTANNPLGKELANAVYARNLSEVKRLVAAGANINYRDTDREGVTPLMLAALKRSADIAAVLINTEGLCINLQDSHKKTALIHVIASTSSLFPATFQSIVKVPGIHPNIKDEDGNTAILLAARSSSLTFVRDVLAIGGVDIHVVNNKGNTVLHELIENPTSLINKGDFDNLIALVGKQQRDVNVVNKAGYTPLMLAAYNAEVGTDFVAQLLLIPNIDINKQNDEGNTALHFSVIKTTNPYSPSSLTHFKGVQINLCNNARKTARTLLKERTDTRLTQARREAMDQAFWECHGQYTCGTKVCDCNADLCT